MHLTAAVHDAVLNAAADTAAAGMAAPVCMHLMALGGPALMALTGGGHECSHLYNHQQSTTRKAHLKAASTAGWGHLSAGLTTISSSGAMRSLPSGGQAG